MGQCDEIIHMQTVPFSWWEMTILTIADQKQVKYGLKVKITLIASLRWMTNVT